MPVKIVNQQTCPNFKTDSKHHLFYVEREIVLELIQICLRNIAGKRLNATMVKADANIISRHFKCFGRIFSYTHKQSVFITTYFDVHYCCAPKLYRFGLQRYRDLVFHVLSRIFVDHYCCAPKLYRFGLQRF